ncbi:glycoside hydrolase family protein [Niabella drilacis]|uniref:Beta-L-arabinofuranosidase, GH127 n=1 Tax=Niabella drilacis (strain DSM 25811 / CCM 8410 / CCUG 62505 / LMG 26954 / E90) TaxID=1285928 RepID=A0A1G6JKQ0_NIADE|nr:beta-L-arabinofuranosidase domain-containing protein [Niabella drilacis]SDC18526.1 Beta-L-arabinofuranosidase, GH127 [Niabella drilacis]
MRYTVIGLFLLVVIASQGQVIHPVSYEDIMPGGEMRTRALKNFDRLESAIYTPEKVFPVQHEITSIDWPGDYEGRIILGLTLQARATHRTPRYLEELIRLIPQKVNVKGYLGPVMTDSIREQQLSGHGWFLRALCEYYNWKKDPAVKKHIEQIIQNLALPTRGYHKMYPIDPSQRNRTTGGAVGTSQAFIGRWVLSSDIGCDFIFMDGVVQAYSIVPSPELKQLIDEMINRFLEVDLKGISAQTHATLTGIRALLRYYELTGNANLLKQAQARYLLYRNMAMTANYENYNWFGRPEWTEPCAIIDAYMVANQLWMYTRTPLFMEDAHHIYFNAIGHTQRANGGFGLDNCPSDTTHLLQVKTYEAYWCCTMRGGEGLASAISYNYFTGDGSVNIPFFSNNTARFRVGGGDLVLEQRTCYPFEGTVELEVKQSSARQAVALALFIPQGAVNPKIWVDGKPVSFTRKQQFAYIRTRLQEGMIILYTFDMEVKTTLLQAGTKKEDPGGCYSFQYGPLQLGFTTLHEKKLDQVPVFTRTGRESWMVNSTGMVLTPVYHLLSPEVRESGVYSRQVLFTIHSKTNELK